jgi:hypothetical protein
MSDAVRDWNLFGTVRLHDLTLGLVHSHYHERLADGLIPEQYNDGAYWAHGISRCYLRHQ